MLAMVAACERGTIDFVITKSISRFARNTTDCLELVRKLLDLNIYIYFEKENINTGSMESELMLSILSGLAESESVSISENEKWGIRRRFQNGTFIISYPPYGYANVDGEMMIVPEQAEIVKQIFADTLAGKSTHEIAKGLNEQGVVTKKGGRWTPGRFPLCPYADYHRFGLRGCRRNVSGHHFGFEQCAQTARRFG